MTEREPDDLELQRYLQGDQPLSRRYRESAQQEHSPPELDARLLAAARAATPRRRRSVRRWAVPMGLAASLMIAGPLAWQLRQAEPSQAEVVMMAPSPSVAEMARAAPEMRRVEKQATMKREASVERQAEAAQAQARAAAASPPAFASDSMAGEMVESELESPTGGYDGFGPAQFGGDEESIRMAWGRPLTVSGREPSACRQLFAEPSGTAGISFMLVDDRFARYDVTTAQFKAPGGTQVGDTRAMIEQRYGDRLSASPHKYVEGAETLSVVPEQGEAKLVLEMTPEGIVERWRVGVPPAIDYVEGCS